MAMLYLRNKPIGAISSGASGGGHTIENPSGTDMAQRSNLQFTDADVTDDSTNDRTEISVVRELMQAEFDELTPEEQNRGVIVIKDANPIYVPSNNAVSVTADGVKTTAQLFAELYALVDVSKITHNTALVRVDGSSGGKTRFSFVTDWNEHEYFSNVMVSSESTKTEELCLYTPASNCYLHRVTGSTYENRSSNVPTSGTTFTLYYNTVCTDKAEMPWTKVASSTPQALTQGTFTQVTLSAYPNLSAYKEVMLVLKDIYTPSNNITVEASSVVPVGITSSMLASYAYPTNEGYYTRAMINFKSDKTTIDKAYLQDGGNHTSNTFFIEVYAR